MARNQELLDDTLDLKIEIVDEMLFAVYAFACISVLKLDRALPVMAFLILLVQSVLE